MKDFQAAKADFDKWTQDWESALERGDFPTDSKPQEESKFNFFGLRGEDADEVLSEQDVNKWRSILKLEDRDYKKTDTPNPIAAGTHGPDQEMSPDSLGITFSNDDLKKVEDLRVKIHDLQDELNASEQMGEDDSLKEQIAKLTKEVDDLSDALSHSCPDELQVNEE